MRNVDLTVLFSTRNGEGVLPRTLEGYCNLETPTQNWKLVVVDNGSTDSTPEILESFKGRLPLEQVHHPIAGKNRALNVGVAAIEGSFVILTDDDAVPHPNFLKAWAKFLDSKSEYELFGGSITPLFETPPPKWLVKSQFHFEILFAARNLPEGPIEARKIFGPNMAVRTSVFNRGFRFNENIGPNKLDLDYPMGSETEFCARLEQSGVACWFANEPLVYHIIRTHQVDEAYWLKRAYRHGRGRARIEWETGQLIGTRPSRYYIIRLLSRARRRLRMLSPFSEQRFKSTYHYYWSQGFDDESARIRANNAR